MLAARAPSGSALRELLLRFRGQAARSETGPEGERRHRDGWGLVALGAGGQRVHVRRPGDASQDPAYEETLAKIAGLRNVLVIVHFRNASVGPRLVANTHPFARDGWYFAHNGTVRDAQALERPAAVYEGQTDSERVFAALMERLKGREDPAVALRKTAEWVAAHTPFTSLTCLLTDGTTLWAMRRLGTDLEDCGTRECQAEYYGLFRGRQGAISLVAQEPTHLGRLEEWTEVPTDEVLVWAPGSDPSAERPGAQDARAGQLTRRVR